MKVIIDIPEDYYKAIKEIPKEQCTGDMLLIKIGTPIPENATNGDVVKAIFSDLCLQYNDIYIEGGGDYYVAQDIINDLYFEYSWWNAPYKGGKQ